MICTLWKMWGELRPLSMSHWLAIFEGDGSLCLWVLDSDICLLSRQRSWEAQEGEMVGRNVTCNNLVLQELVLIQYSYNKSDYGNDFWRFLFNLHNVWKEAKIDSLLLSHVIRAALCWLKLLFSCEENSESKSFWNTLGFYQMLKFIRTFIVF